MGSACPWKPIRGLACPWALGGKSGEVALYWGGMSVGGGGVLACKGRWHNSGVTFSLQAHQGVGIFMGMAQ